MCLKLKFIEYRKKNCAIEFKEHDCILVLIPGSFRVFVSHEIIIEFD